MNGAACTCESEPVGPHLATTPDHQVTREVHCEHVVVLRRAVVGEQTSIQDTDCVQVVHDLLHTTHSVIFHILCLNTE